MVDVETMVEVDRRGQAVVTYTEVVSVSSLVSAEVEIGSVERALCTDTEMHALTTRKIYWTKTTTDYPSCPNSSPTSVPNKFNSGFEPVPWSCV